MLVMRYPFFNNLFKYICLNGPKSLKVIKAANLNYLIIHLMKNWEEFQFSSDLKQIPRRFLLNTHTICLITKSFLKNLY